MLKGDNDNIVGTSLAMLQYDMQRYPNGKSIKGLYKWYKPYMRRIMGRFYNPKAKLNRKFIKQVIKNKNRLDNGDAMS